MNIDCRKKSNRGFTMIELLVTVAILAIVTAIGIPGFVEIINDSRLTTNANQLVASLNLARSEAIKRSTKVYVANIGNQGRNWDNGWLIFIDENTNSIFDEDTDTLLKTYPALTNKDTLRVGRNINNWIAYKPSGLYETSTGRLNDSFRLCTVDEDEKVSRAIIVNSIGRARVTKNNVSSCS
jgi:type IV fimbrial biogenesis protein FimT